MPLRDPLHPVRCPPVSARVTGHEAPARPTQAITFPAHIQTSRAVLWSHQICYVRQTNTQVLYLTQTSLGTYTYIHILYFTSRAVPGHDNRYRAHHTTADVPYNQSERATTMCMGERPLA